MTTQDLTKLLTEYTTDVFGHEYVTQVDVQPGEDSDGDPILYVDVVWRSGLMLTATPQRVAFRSYLRRFLEQKGETRFPVVSFIPENEFERRASA